MHHGRQPKSPSRLSTRSAMSRPRPGTPAPIRRPQRAPADGAEIRDYNPFISHDFLSSLELSGSVRNRAGWQPMHLVAEARRHDRRRRALLRQIALAGRIRLRPRLGRRLRARRRRLLSEAPGRGAVHAGDGPPAAGAARASSRRVRDALAELLADICKRSNASSVHVTFLTEDEWQLLGLARLSPAHPPAVPLVNEGYGTSTPSSPRSSSRKRKAIRRERADALANGITVALAHRRRPDRKRVGRILRVLHGYGLAQMGPALSHPRVLFDRRREDARPDPAGHGQAQRPLDRRRHQFHRLRYAVRPPLGLRRAARLPAFRDLLLSGDRSMRSRTSSAASRRAPAASTRSRAAICR